MNIPPGWFEASKYAIERDDNQVRIAGAKISNRWVYTVFVKNGAWKHKRLCASLEHALKFVEDMK